MMASSTERPFQAVSHGARELSEEEVAKLSEDVKLLSEFKQNKLEAEAKKNWDLFYKRNTTKFFKDRHWTKREFEELTNSCKNLTSKQVIFEVGCGVGNFMFPLLAEDDHLYFYACDFSPRAVDFVKSHQAYDVNRCTAFQCDITTDTIREKVPAGTVDVATMIFVLSAIHPDKMVQSVKNVAKTLKPGGVLLVRDYGLYDHAMLRFSKGHKLSDCFYVRQDGTRAYYFSIEKLNSVMEEAGLKTKHISYIQRSTVNVKERINVPRIFVQGTFSKGPSPDFSKDCNSKRDSDCVERVINLGPSSVSHNNMKKESLNPQDSIQSMTSKDFSQEAHGTGYNLCEGDVGLVSNQVTFESNFVALETNLQKLGLTGEEEKGDSHSRKKSS